MPDDRCPKCGALYALVGYRHLCKGNGLRAPPDENPVVTDARKVGHGVDPPTREAVAPAKRKQRGKKQVQAAKSKRRRGSRGPAKGEGGRPRKGQEGKTLRATKPWKKQGISQRTWYRYRAEKAARAAIKAAAK